MKFAFATLVAAVSALDVNDFEYMNYLAQFNKAQNSVQEYNMRRDIFNEVDAFIKEHNASNASYRAGHNQFSDWTRAEYKSILGYVRGEMDVRKEATVFDTNDLPASVNWVDAGAVTAVKDQGQCGSCWAFSTTGSIEGAHFVASGELLSFSEQQLVDCAFLKYGNMGCNGGLQSYAYNYYEDGHNAEQEPVYPYTATKGTCQYDSSSTTAVTVTDYTNVTPSNVDQMKAALVNQPLAIAIEADKLCFQTYH